MTPDERQLLNAKIAVFLRDAFVRIRFLTFPTARLEAMEDGTDPAREVNDLADLCHNLPRYLVGHDEDAVVSERQLRETIAEYIRRFYPKIDPAQHRYVQLFEMDEAAFRHTYARHLAMA